MLGWKIGNLMVLAFFALAATTWGNEMGQVHYEMLCASCHGKSGEGGSEGSSPPLVGSEWVKGDPARLVQIILHGIEGPLEVKGQAYNFVMPPHGAALDDKQIAGIASYVRRAWGNERSSIEEGFVLNARKETRERKKMWTADELEHRWPLPAKSGPLENLFVYVYEGAFRVMPKFESLESVVVKEEPLGFLNVKSLGKGEKYAAVWEGDFEVEQSGTYTFRLDSDDGSRVFVNGARVVALNGQGAMGRQNQGAIRLDAGRAKLRVEYFNYKGNQGLTLSMRHKEKWTHFTRQKPKPIRRVPSIPLVVEEEARIYRNFIEGASANGIGVGYPGGVNLAFCGDDLGLGVAWVGKFIDAGLHWTGRGAGFQSPAGQRVVKFGDGPAFAVGLKNLRKWPQTWQPKAKARFKGYVLDGKRFPEFRYEVAGIQITDKPLTTEGHVLVRNLSFEVKQKPPEDLVMRVAGKGVEGLSSHVFKLQDGMRLEVAKCDGVKCVANSEGLYLRLKLEKGVNRIGLRYVWK